MADKLIFVSHIHEEKKLASLVKDKLESEFSGFVEVFVSSDGKSIPAGANFLKRIEDGLVDCVAAIYFISPWSVRRNWINCELGAVWIRNIMSLRADGPEIPTVPFCHSGTKPSGLPAPLNNLNGISCNEASQLEYAFRSIQSAVGGSGNLKTDFDLLASKIRNFEQGYTIGESVAKLVRLLGGDAQKLVTHCESAPKGSQTTVKCGFLDTGVIRALNELRDGALSGRIQVQVENAGISFGTMGATNGADVSIQLPVDLVTEFKSQILA